MTVRSIIAILLCTFTPLTFAQDSKPAEKSASENAELKLLRATVERQNKQIEELKAQVEKLKALVPAGTTQPADNSVESKVANNPSRKIFFLRTDSGENSGQEIVRAVAELSGDQMFYVATPIAKKLQPFFNVWAEASKYYKDKLRKEMDRFAAVSYEDAESIISTAIKFQPDVLWIVGPVFCSNEEKQVQAILKARGSSKTRINTTSAYGYPWTDKAKGYHFLWRIAKETGGVFIDGKGNVLDEPPLPVEIPIEKPVEKPKPSILKP